MNKYSLILPVLIQTITLIYKKTNNKQKHILDLKIGNVLFFEARFFNNLYNLFFEKKKIKKRLTNCELKKCFIHFIQVITKIIDTILP